MEEGAEMSRQFEDLLTAYMVARDYVIANKIEYSLFNSGVQERREARQNLLAYVAELEAKAGAASPEKITKNEENDMYTSNSNSEEKCAKAPIAGPKEGIIWAQINKLIASVSNLYSAIDDLENRLSPVLPAREEVRGSGDSSAPTMHEGLSPLASSIECEARRVNGLLDKVIRMLTELEL